VRETLFNVLRNWIDFQGLSVLDLFAGTGALGLEALSRGAQHVTFVENGRVGQKLIGENIARMRAQDRSKLISQDATKLPPGAACNLVFLDPPYGKSLGQQALRSAWTQGWITADALIIFEEADTMTPEGFVLRDSRKFGGTTMTFLQPI
jgi:16S rRNA (guanine966-N2)-methyltransferase